MLVGPTPHLDHTFHKRDDELGVLLGHDIGARDDGGGAQPARQDAPQIAPESFIGALEQCWPIGELLLAGRPAKLPILLLLTANVRHEELHRAIRHLLGC